MPNLTSKLRKFNSNLRIQMKPIDLQSNLGKVRCVQSIKHLIVKIAMSVGLLEL
jgi:hypothetical protein